MQPTIDITKIIKIPPMIKYKIAFQSITSFFCPGFDEWSLSTLSVVVAIKGVVKLKTLDVGSVVGTIVGNVVDTVGSDVGCTVVIFVEDIYRSEIASLQLNTRYALPDLSP
eukprot:201863_1